MPAVPMLLPHDARSIHPNRAQMRRPYESNSDAADWKIQEPFHGLSVDLTLDLFYRNDSQSRPRF